MEYQNKLFNLDCIAGMSLLPDGCMDMILTDLPYGVTNCKWDCLIPFEQLWPQFWRVLKPNGAICLTACQPFTTQLISSQRKHFRYCWYWVKNMTTGFTFAKKQPLRCVEEVCVFYWKAPTYNPQGIIILDKPIRRKGKTEAAHRDCVYHMDTLSKDTETCVVHYPRQVLEIKCERGLHPTQKPVALFEYLIQTYTNPGENVLDACIGSGTTKVACRNTGRNYTGFEIDPRYFEIAEKR